MHYNYFVDHLSGAYKFTTDFGVQVTIFIVRDRWWFPDNPEIRDAYTFDLQANPASSQFDAKIGNTVMNILAPHFENKNTVIAYTCDHEDGKGHKRHLKFQRWYNSCGNESILKYNRQFIVKEDVEDGQIEHIIYTSLLIHEENPRLKTIERLYQSGDNDKTDKITS